MALAEDFSWRIKMKRSQTLLAGTVVCLFALLPGCANSGSASATIDPAMLKAYAPLPEVANGKEPITEIGRASCRERV